MSARNIRALLACAAIVAAAPAVAQEGASPKLKINLTEEPEPDSKAWEDPARISATIDPDGPDSFSAQINVEVARSLTPSTAARQKALKAFVVWARETAADERQNHFQAGGAFTSALSNIGMDRSPGENGPAPDPRFDMSSRVYASYGRKAVYADTTTPTCVATPTAPQCNTQFEESVRGGAAFAIFGPGFERHPKGFLAYSIAPKFGFDYDHLINNPIDPDTGSTMKGGYLSGLAGIGVSIFPSFDAPRWELSASTQLRQRITASDSRRASIKSSAVLFEAAATFYVVRPEKDGDWRAGVGLVYTRGDDPLTGQDGVNKIVLSLRIGRY